MKKIIISLSLFYCGIVHPICHTVTKKAADVTSALPEGCYLVDETKAILYGPERTRVFTKLETEGLGIDGAQQTVQDLIDRELICQEAFKFKVPVDESFIDRYIASVCSQYNISQEKIPDTFGFSLEKIRAELRDLYLN